MLLLMVAMVFEILIQRLWQRIVRIENFWVIFMIPDPAGFRNLEIIPVL
jgi:hypothetical protein